jgi:PAS domain S-box-containing protein
MKNTASISALKIAGGYAIVAGLWILFSDQFLSLVIDDVARIQRLQTAKGWAFVGVTALLLFLVLRRELSISQQAHKELLRLNRALRVLSECNQALIRANDVDSLLQTICDQIVNLGGYHMAWVGYAVQDENQTIRPIAKAGDDAGYLDSIRVSWGDNDLGKGPAGASIRTGRTSIYLDLASHPAFTPWREAAIERGYRAIIGLPLQHNEQVYGSLCIYTSEANAFEPDEVRLLEELASDLAYGIHVLQTQERFYQQSQVLNALFDASPLAIYILDVYGMVEYWNPAAERIFGWSESEVLGKRLPIVDAEHQAEFDALRQRVISGESFTDIEITRIKKGEEMIELSLSTAPLRDASGQVSHIVAIAVDITRRKQAEKTLLDLNAELEQRMAERIKTEEYIRMQLSHLEALRRIDLAITSSLDLKVILDVLLAQVINQLKVDAADVRLITTYDHNLDIAAARGFLKNLKTSQLTRVGTGYAGMTALDRKPRLVNSPAEIDDESPGLREIFIQESFQFYYVTPLIAKGQAQGVLEVYKRTSMEIDREWIHFLEAIAGQAAIAIDNSTLFNDLQRTNLELTRAYEETIEGWSRALDLRDKETEGHTRRVTEMTLRLARRMGISDGDLVHIRRGALLHDIGKMGVPDSILLKPGPLTKEEWATMRLHPGLAYNMLSPIDHLRLALDIPYCHHEKWDGTGYPRGLKGEEIPLAARLFAVVDVWDALRSDRPYRPAWSKEEAIAFIHSETGSHFDPEVAKLFLETRPDRDELYP